ncbi:MAG: hypothetical protein M1821_000042 [Bathelium mastoideum]|nr:MAG: hypothetical protein M1821_000042 [Bathelium mastoideum]
MAAISSLNDASKKWPKGAHAAVALTLDNMGEAADIQRKLWPESQPIGAHYSVTRVLPQILSLLRKYDVLVTYSIEAWNLRVYGDVIAGQVATAGHEIGWHAWQHETWSKLTDKEEQDNFARSFGKDGIGGFVGPGARGTDKVEKYRGFRPPGGLIHGTRTLDLCREYGLRYLSPAANEPAVIPSKDSGDSITILPFKWATVDAYYYMETFAALRETKEEYTSEPQPPYVLMQSFKKEVDLAIKRNGYISLLFHAFLTDRPERLEAMESVLKYLAQKRDEGVIWLAKNKEIDEWVRGQPHMFSSDPQWDLVQWR